MVDDSSTEGLIHRTSSIINTYLIQTLQSTDNRGDGNSILY